MMNNFLWGLTVGFLLLPIGGLIMATTLKQRGWTPPAQDDEVEVKNDDRESK